MSETYLEKNRPRRAQFRAVRRGTPTGCTVIHTAENALDLIGADTGAENVARFIVGRADPGSYHDLVDSDSAIHLVPYKSEAFQDGTGSNPWALSISFALKASDWPRLTPGRRDAFLRQGVLAFRRQQAWLRSNGYPTTPLRRITKAQSNGRSAGFIAHADRDPGRRTDPGAEFPWDRFFELIAEVNTYEGDTDMLILRAETDGAAWLLRGSGEPIRIATAEGYGSLTAAVRVVNLDEDTLTRLGAVR